MKLLLPLGPIAATKSQGEFAESLALLWEGMQWLVPKPLEGG